MTHGLVFDKAVTANNTCHRQMMTNLILKSNILIIKIYYSMVELYEETFMLIVNWSPR